jgi:hypothetical protein
VKEKTVTDAVVTKVREVCGAYMDPGALLPIAKKALADAHAGDTEDSRIQWMQSRIDILTGRIDKMYMDRLAGILNEEDFRRIYQKMKAEKSALEDKMGALQRKQQEPEITEDQTKRLTERFLENACVNRALLISLIERIELSEDKQIYIRFRFPEGEAIS